LAYYFVFQHFISPDVFKTGLITIFIVAMVVIIAYILQPSTLIFDEEGVKSKKFLSDELIPYCDIDKVIVVNFKSS